jgi:glycosyltransferase involved in cell wall biosynthesis
MKFSIITPEHTNSNLKFLLELQQTILDQTYTNWEWIVYCNGDGVDTFLIENALAKDPRISVVQGKDYAPDFSIGHIKHDAFMLGTGDVLVEVDHDDLITPDCLEELEIAFQDEEVGFVYSDNATLDMTGEFIPYLDSHGWTYYMTEWEGEEHITMKSFPPTSHSIGLIWYAPDHVRSWRKSLYHEIGGHNLDYLIADDAEIMIRTYLATKMYKIEKTLYLYRITGHNTFSGDRNQLIQDTTRELFRVNIEDLAIKDAKDRGLLAVDIGGGSWPRKDCINVDLWEGADVVHDLNDRLPFEDGSVGMLRAYHILEHLPDKQKIMKEIYRVLAHGGWFICEVPSTDGRGAFQDPTHVSYWNANSFWYYCSQEYARFIYNDGGIRFQQYDCYDWYASEEHKIINTRFIGVALKDDYPRYPGEIRI